MTVVFPVGLRSVALSQSILSRARAAAVAAAAGLLLSACVADSVGVSNSGARHLVPLSSQTVALLEEKGMDKQAPILLRIYKEEAELQVWKQTREGRYAHLKTYPICRWSGELGPKVKEGDRQAPEGFYAITPELMNPHSNYHLAFNLGFPNAFDQSLGRSGAFLMVHGDCSSRGCYAMTDEQISEIFALAREAFDGGQLAFQVQAFPFHMTAQNLASHRNSPHLAFWRMLKEGSDHFEMSGLEPKIDVCGQRYVFNGIPQDMSKVFNPMRTCPAYDIPAEIASAVGAKRQKDEREFAALEGRNIPTLPVRTGRDGGTNPVFVSRLAPQNWFAGADGQRIVAQPVTPGTVPANARLPEPDGSTATVAVTETQQNPQMASASGMNWGSSFSLRRLLGFDDEKRVETPPTAKQVPLPPRRPAAASQSQTARANGRVPKPAVQDEEEDEQAKANFMRGAQPIRQPGGFSSFQQN
jgi:murein L,D-transpeptidase YafK